MTPTDAKDETPRVDAARNESYLRRAGGTGMVNVGFDDDAWDFARQLERELLAAQTENERLARERHGLADEAEQHLLRANQEQGKRIAAEAAAARLRDPHLSIDSNEVRVLLADAADALETAQQPIAEGEIANAVSVLEIDGYKRIAALLERLAELLLDIRFAFEHIKAVCDGTNPKGPDFTVIPQMFRKIDAALRGGKDT